MGFGWGIVVGVPGLADVDLGVEKRVTQASVPEFGAMEKDVEAPGNANLGKGLLLLSGFLGQLLASQKMGCTWRESESHVPMGIQACKLGLKAHMSEIALECALRSIRKAGKNRPGGAVRLFNSGVECAEGLFRQREVELS